MLKKNDEILDSFTLKELKNQASHIENLHGYYRYFYEELAEQREKYFSEIQAVLLEKSTRNFKFKEWFRAVPFKYCLHPLSAVGSLKISGRFNFGNDINPSTPIFPALYVAENKTTALSETLGQNIVKAESDQELNHYDLSLIKGKNQSELILLLDGELDNIFELDNSKSLIKFTNIIKKFKLSSATKNMAKKLKNKLTQFDNKT